MKPAQSLPLKQGPNKKAYKAFMESVQFFVSEMLPSNLYFTRNHDLSLPLKCWPIKIA